MATIITAHIPENDVAALAHVCPGIRIHAIDIVQPPGIGISPMDDMDAHQEVVKLALTTKSSAETPRKACSENLWETMDGDLPFCRSAAANMTFTSPLAVLVVPPPPHARFVPTFGCAVEPLVHAPDAVDAAGIRGISVIDNAVVEHE